MKQETLTKLQEKLDRNLVDYLAVIQTLTPSAAFLRAGELHAASSAYYWLYSGHGLEATALEQLLALENPLETVRDAWLEYDGGITRRTGEILEIALEQRQEDGHTMADSMI